MNIKPKPDFIDQKFIKLVIEKILDSKYAKKVFDIRYKIENNIIIR